MSSTFAPAFDWRGMIDLFTIAMLVMTVWMGLLLLTRARRMRGGVVLAAALPLLIGAIAMCLGQIQIQNELIGSRGTMPFRFAADEMIDATAHLMLGLGCTLALSIQAIFILSRRPRSRHSSGFQVIPNSPINTAT